MIMGLLGLLRKLKQIFCSHRWCCEEEFRMVGDGELEIESIFWCVWCGKEMRCYNLPPRHVYCRCGVEVERHG